MPPRTGTSTAPALAKEAGERDAEPSHKGERGSAAAGIRRTTGRTRKTIDVQGTPITVLSRKGEDFISLTDMVRDFEGGDALVEQWLRSKDTTIDLFTAT